MDDFEAFCRERDEQCKGMDLSQQSHLAEMTVIIFKEEE
jgi:hypothetical protein